MPPPKAKHSKMVTLLNYRLKVTLNDGRALVGQMLAYDKHMNFVLAECEEFRTVKGKKTKTSSGENEPAPTVQQKRTLGLVILRGETIVSVTVEGPPPVQGEDKVSQMLAGPGRGVPAGRGMGLGAGAPAMAARPMAYARPPPGFPPGMGVPPGMPPGFPGGLPPGMPPPAGMPPGFRPPGFPGAPPGMAFPPGQMPPGFPARPPQ
ncbi:hypothetical protein BCR39DRAFT_554678 [Naematelia encephala]|uniref:Sm protein B n=1 Tax=Naematelia encephala TaxID=71784 RepID=A0A1Y2AEX9_9TREE|nr:hypothetical protein BCR39DRAFT_554678 [Naematelia encephala]